MNMKQILNEEEDKIKTSLQKLSEDIQLSIEETLKLPLVLTSSVSTSDSTCSTESVDDLNVSGSDNLLSTITRLKTIQRIRKITMFHKVKANGEDSLQQAESKKSSEEKLKKKEEIRQGKKDKELQLKEHLPSLRREALLVTLIALRDSTNRLKNIEHLSK